MVAHNSTEERNNQGSQIGFAFVSAEEGVSSVHVSRTPMQEECKGTNPFLLLCADSRRHLCLCKAVHCSCINSRS